MSALTKPFISSTTCDTPSVLVPAEKIITMDPFNIVDPQGSATQRGIIFVVDTLNSAPREIKLIYSSGANDAANIVLRDAALVNMGAIINTPI